MNAYALLETALVTLIVAACAIKAFGRFAPRTRARLQSWVARGLDRPGRAAWMRAWARKLGSAAPGGGCGSGCDACGSCAPTDTKPVHIHK